MHDDALVAKMRQALDARGDSYQPRTEHFTSDGEPLYINRLIFEDSPYLLQHAHNPVNWYPWGDEAFAMAAQQDKPVLLSIGYATCHWCHVMERESFENEAIADKLNEHFIAIKVDREQLPDVDATYMTAVQILTGSGGWPMNTFLTEQGKPFHGGTYFPPNVFSDLLDQVRNVWVNDPPTVLDFADRLSEAVSVGNALSGSVR
ncbi:MAG: thioredoxin domain-containing protein, partial [Pseudomonadota bacterium]